MPTPTLQIPHRQLVAWFEQLGTSTGLFRVVPRKPQPARMHTQEVLSHELEIELSEGQQRLRLLLEVKKQVHPKHVVVSLSPLAAMARTAGHNTLAVLVASYISPRVAQVCRDCGVGYVDAAGNAHLVAPGLCVHIEGRPNLQPDTRPAEHLFAPKSSRIVRTLLENPSRHWRVQDLAVAAKVSIGLASRIKHKLVDEAYARETPNGVRLADPVRLLGEWVAAYKIPRHRIHVYSLDGPEVAEHGVLSWGDRHGIPCALGEFSAASRLAPMVRSTRAVVYVLADRGSDIGERLMSDLALTPVDSGTTVELWMTEDESAFQGAQDLAGTRVVSPLQAYLDVIKNPARGQEAADALFQRFLQPLFADQVGGV